MRPWGKKKRIQRKNKENPEKGADARGRGKQKQRTVVGKAPDSQEEGQPLADSREPCGAGGTCFSLTGQAAGLFLSDAAPTPSPRHGLQKGPSFSQPTGATGGGSSGWTLREGTGFG